jgi:tryptophan synthase beta chain
MGIFSAFLADAGVRLVGVEAAGLGLDSGKHGAALARGTPGVLHGSRSYVLQDPNGQIIEAHSISAGLDYPGVGPELAWLKDQGRVELRQATDDQALEALTWLARLEGIIPALETAHAVHAARGLARELGPSGLLVINISGRGDKDVDTVRKALAAKATAPRRRAARRKVPATASKAPATRKPGPGPAALRSKRKTGRTGRRS